MLTAVSLVWACSCRRSSDAEPRIFVLRMEQEDCSGHFWKMLLPNYQVRTFQENCIWFLYHLLVGTFYEVSPVLSSCYVLFQKMILDTSGAGAQGGGAHGCNPAVGYGAFTAWVLLSQNEISTYFD